MAYNRAYTFICAAFVVLFALACSSYETPSAFRQVVLHLDQFQTPSGGFVLSREAGAKPSLEATSHALFLSSLFGLKKKINSNAVPTYLQTLENGDSGYGKSAGLASDLESVRHAVLSYQRLGLTVPNSANVAAFIKSLVDPETRLIASRAGEAGNLKATALAFQTLEILGELQRSWVQESVDPVKNYLQQHAKPGNYHFAFPEEKDLPFLSANYYGVVLGSFVGFDFGNLAKWAQFIVSLQSKTDGGFYTSSEKTSTSLESTADAISSLRLLQQIQSAKDNKATSFVDTVDTAKLAEYVKNIPEDLRSAANAHLAIALTKEFVHNFEVSTSYEVLRATGVVGETVVQGTQLRPILSVKTFGGVAHAGLDVVAQITAPGAKTPSSSKLHWKETEQYVSDESFDTSNLLGSLTFNYVIRCFVAGVGELSFEKTDQKQVGYGLIVDSSAKLEISGKEFDEGDSVPIGTDFTFSVTLQNQTNHNLVSGDFSVVFTVVDSSDVAITSQTVDCKANKGPVTFKHTLKSNNIPGGNIGFRFEVSNANGVHTTKTVTYQLSLPMIATAITFNGFTHNQAPTYKIGDNVQVSIEPATFPDLHTVYPYPVAGASQRKFFMDVSSPAGVLLRSVAGKFAASTTNAKYSFEVPVTATLDNIGTNVVSFRYVPSSGEDIRLSNYDTTFGELYEDAAALNYTVRAELYMVDVKDQPSAHDYYYGNEISYRFAVLDAVSGKRIEKGSNDNANIYLSLQHSDEDKSSRSFASTNEPAAEVVEDGQKSYNIRWAINPNAVQGQGYLALSAQDADGNRFPLYVEGSKGKSVRYDVNIGGNISVAYNTYSTSDTAFENTAFVAQFTLSCQDKSLRNAQLRCSVVRKDNGEAVASLLPAATNHAGDYAVSFTVPHNDAPSGDYVFRCYREVDRQRAQAAKEAAEKKRRIAEELKQFGEQVDAADLNVADLESTLQPLFTIPLRHSAPYTGRLPLRTEYLALVIFGAAFFYASYQKRRYVAKQ